MRRFLGQAADTIGFATWAVFIVALPFIVAIVLGSPGDPIPEEDDDASSQRASAAVALLVVVLPLVSSFPAAVLAWCLLLRRAKHRFESWLELRVAIEALVGGFLLYATLLLIYLLTFKALVPALGLLLIVVSPVAIGTALYLPVAWVCTVVYVKWIRRTLFFCIRLPKPNLHPATIPAPA
jgi:hypothetical protein